MKLTDKMKIVLESIWQLRAATGKIKLNHSEVERITATLTESKQPISRQNWYACSNKSWEAIKEAIEGKLPDNHPIELYIAKFSEGDKTGLFQTRIIELQSNVTLLNIKLAEKTAELESLETLIYKQQYIDNDARINFFKVEREYHNSIKSDLANVKVIQNLQAEILLLKSEKDKVKKMIGSIGTSVENAKYELSEPDDIEVTNDAFNRDVLNTYLSACQSMFDKSCSRWELKTPNDIIFLFHSFNILSRDFIQKEVIFRYTEKNFVISCCLFSPTCRHDFYKRASEIIHPLKPQVYIVTGGDINSPGIGKNNKVVSLTKDSNHKRLWEMAANLGSDFDVISEGYDNVRIVRF